MNTNLTRNWLFKNFYDADIKLRILYSLIILLVVMLISNEFITNGGGNSVLSHAMYLPILLAAILFRIPGGLICGLLAGLALRFFPGQGPIPSNLSDPSAWYFQTGFFMLIGGINGLMVNILENQRKKNEWLFLHNTRTGIPNTEFLYKEIEEAIQKQKYKKGFYLTVVIITNFFDITNTLGMEFGDRLMHQVVQRLTRQLGSQSEVCQLGLDMLGFIMPNANHENAKTLKLLKSLTKSFKIEKIPVYTEVILGQSIYPPHGEKPATLFQKAVIAAEIAKTDNKQFFVYDAERDNTSVENFELLGQVSNAIGKNQFEFFYQPMIDTKTGRPISAEALIRWNHPTKGMISPLQFIPKLEMTGLIYSLTQWGIPESLKQIADWEKIGININISVNISVKNLQDPNFVDSVEKLLKTCKFAHSKLELEITERAFLVGFDEAINNLERLKALGVSISIDDFGTGFSTLDSLKKCPIDFVKIDQVLIRDILKNEKDRSIVESTINMAKNLGITVVAEGVEDQETYDLLTKMGCDHVQGYFISRPIPENQATAWLIKNILDEIEQPI